MLEIYMYRTSCVTLSSQSLTLLAFLSHLCLPLRMLLRTMHTTMARKPLQALTFVVKALKAMDRKTTMLALKAVLKALHAMRQAPQAMRPKATVPALQAVVQPAGPT